MNKQGGHSRLVDEVKENLGKTKKKK